VKDVSKVEQFPQEGRMASEIPEEVAKYDDQLVPAHLSLAGSVLQLQ